MGVDPLADEFPSWTPYHYVHNNPLRYTDPDGRSADDIIVRGANNSSVTIVTDLVDIEVNASSLGVDFGGNYSLGGSDITHAALDVAGVVDPTGVADAANASLYAAEGKGGDALISGLGIIPFVGDLAKVGRIGKSIDKITDGISLAKKGRSGKQARLRELANDPKVSSADRGWIKNEMRHIKTGNRKSIRNPRNSRNSRKRGTELAHPRGKRAKDGHSYKNARVQDAKLHKLEHKHGGYK